MTVPHQLSAIIVTRRKAEELDGILANLLNQDRPPDEVIVWDNDPAGSGRAAGGLRDRTVRYCCPGEDSGLTVGRNSAAAMARGDILLFVADHLRFDKYHVTNVLMNLFRPREVSAITFQVRDASSKELVPSEFPTVRLTRWGEARRVGALSSCAFAIRRNVFEELGGLDEQLRGGEEGLELAFRITRAGGEVRYQPEILVNERTSLRDPEPSPAAYRLLRNRLYVALKHLPWPCVATYALRWGAAGLLAALRDRQMPEFSRAVRAFTAEGLWEALMAYRQAHPPSWSFVNLLLQLDGRAFG